jgi:hypothetical protein
MVVLEEVSILRQLSEVCVLATERLSYNCIIQAVDKILMARKYKSGYW